MKVMSSYPRAIILYTMFMLPFGYQSMAQNQYTSKNNSDPKAKTILDKLKKKYDSYKTMEINFALELELPNKPIDKQNGTAYQDGKKYTIKMKDQEIYCDTKSVWMYYKKNKEVQISDYEESEASYILSPKQVLAMYEKGEYIYAITDERKVGNTVFTDIEFKPVSKRSDFTKIRMTLDKSSNNILSLRVFSKDGSKYTLKIIDIKSNKKYDPALFIFNPKADVGVHIEDLRID